MPYMPSKEQFELELFRWKNDHNKSTSQYITQTNGVVTVSDLQTCRLNETQPFSKWQDSAKQVVLGLFAQENHYKSLPYKLTAIIGHAPRDKAVRDWVRKFQQRYTRRCNALL